MAGSAATTNPRSSAVDDIVRRSAGRYPDRVAVVFGDRRWPYRELDGANSDAYLLAFLGCARAGLIHVPVNPRSPAAS